MPTSRKAKGPIQATVSKPPRTGSARAMGPYLTVKNLKTGGVGGAGIELGVQVGDLAGGVGAAYVVALEQDLAAAAGAHEVVAEAAEAGRGVAGAEHGEGDEDDEDELEGALIHGDAPGDAAIRAEYRGLSTRCAPVEMPEPSGSVDREPGCGEGTSTRRVAGLSGGTSAMKVPKITMTTPTQIQLTSGLMKNLMMGRLVIRVGAFEDDVEVVLERGVDGDDGGGLGVVGVDEVDATLGREAGDQLAVVVDVEQRELRIVVRIRVFGVALADDLVAAHVHGVAEAHLGFLGLVEGRAGQADEHDDHAEMNQVAAVAPGVAAGKKDGRFEQVLAGLGVDDVGAAQELGHDGGDDADAERDADQRVDAGADIAGCLGIRRPGTYTCDDQHDAS